MPTRTIAYLRVSTEKQADRGVSLDAQRGKVAAYAQLYDLELVDTTVDAGESAKSLDRPGLKRAVAVLKAAQAEALLVVKLDRLTRSVVDLGTLVEGYFAPGKAALLSVGEQIDTRSAAGRLVLNVLASVSQWEREAIGERTATAMQHKASRGEYTGGQAPYGRRVAVDGERLEEDPQEAEARAVARQVGPFWCVYAGISRERDTAVLATFRKGVRAVARFRASALRDTIGQNPRDRVAQVTAGTRCYTRYQIYEAWNMPSLVIKFMEATLPHLHLVQGTWKNLAAATTVAQPKSSLQKCFESTSGGSWLPPSMRPWRPVRSARQLPSGASGIPNDWRRRFRPCGCAPARHTFARGPG